ncbi:MAG: hypothetical protein K940chlam1_01334, partial [Candidatus Anoxychlamydiales bacterium]|nr:hypothetical protein [Candidatus Anoxychlamydiales bacterium]
MTLKILAAQSLMKHVLNQGSDEKTIEEFRKINEFAKRYIKYFTSPDPLMAAMTDIEIMPDTKCDEPEYLKMLEEN